ncbi:MAG: tRNA (N6-isopentenyl adenosine(37)-C2)-methylthiotransferase MiaB [Lentisphaerae bacterium GWF2_57_35]|nr:MAG: tRNA (N6-isopentenyl adenosine(37)-C2)-methylthiotransferase MiaB [Lentisphaerae bacterium GWF2_57_35]
MTLTYHIWTIGCQMNEADSRHLASRLESVGCTPAERADEADLLILNTCVVRQQAEDKIYSRLLFTESLKRKKKGLIVALMGCLVGKKETEALRQRFPFIDVFMSPSEISPLLDFIQGAKAPSAEEDLLQDYNLPAPEKGQTIATHVPVVLGCSHACSYCVIPYQRGPEKSRPSEDILEEILRLAQQGVREVTLLGQIVDRYGLDFKNGASLAGLLRQTAAVEGISRVRFLTSHPNWMNDEILEAVLADARICPHFEVPFQAGSDEVLKRMRRGYTLADYQRLIDRIRQKIPHAGISADVIVGFCGETETQYLETVRLVEEIQPDMLRIAKYSSRPQTHAARHLPDDVPEDEKERRRVHLEKVLREQLDKRHRLLAGSIVQILVEALEKEGRWRGRTPQNKVVFCDDERDLLGQLVDVKLEWTQPFSMGGKAV